ncbi:MAG: phosphotransferase family protein [Marinosulfonomonas sp.]|nr:phosphotransferase family protein [Marinosulfonomonas sp.]
MPDNQQAVYEALQNLPQFVGVARDSYKATRLGGLTNLVYRIDNTDENLIVRIPGDGTDDYIDRAVELHNAQAAHLAGVSPEILWADGQIGVMISRCITAETMTPAQFSSRDGSPARAGVALAELHNSGQEFRFRFELFTMIDDYLKILAGKDTALPVGYSDIVKAAQPVKQALADNPALLTPCHCDPLCENFLDDGVKMWIIDWEYSGMNDPLWDLGDLSVEAGFTSAQDIEMLQAYFGTEPSGAQIGRMVIYKAMCDLLWTLWGLIQHADNNPAEDFWAYATGRFERCKRLMQSDGFGAHLAAVRG